MERRDVDSVEDSARTALACPAAGPGAEVVADRQGCYVHLSDAEFRRRIRSAYSRMATCDLCPRRCGAHRLAGETGVCGAALKPRVFVWNLHRGEEPPVSGTRGSGTVFFSGCNLTCCYCQNYPLSQLRHGHELTTHDLAGALLELQAKGAHNINFVTPSHQVPQLLAALYDARLRGLHIPIVYNTSSYDDRSTLALLDGVVDIYLADLRYTDDAVALQLSGVSDYVTTAEQAIVEMHRQVGDLVVDERGIAVRGLIVRHLVMPEGVEDAKNILRWIHDTIGPQTSVSLLHNYEPCHRAVDDPVIGRRLRPEEYREVRDLAEHLGFSRVWPPISSSFPLS